MLEWGAGSVQRLVKYMSMRSWQKRSPLFVWHEIKQEKCSRCPMLQHCGQRHKALLCSRTRFSIETHLFQLSQPTYGWWYLLWNSCSSYSYRNNGIFLTDPEIWMSERGWKSSILLQWCHLNYVCISVCACVCVHFYGKAGDGRKKTYLSCISNESLSKSSTVSFFYQNICQTKPPNCLWSGNLV